MELVLLKTKVEVARPLEVKLDDTGAVVAEDEVLSIALVPESLAEVIAGVLIEVTDVLAVSWALVDENPEVEVDCCELVSVTLEIGTLLKLEEDCCVLVVEDEEIAVDCCALVGTTLEVSCESVVTTPVDVEPVVILEEVSCVLVETTLETRLVDKVTAVEEVEVACCVLAVVRTLESVALMLELDSSVPEVAILEAGILVAAVEMIELPNRVLVLAIEVESSAEVNCALVETEVVGIRLVDKIPVVTLDVADSTLVLDTIVEITLLSVVGGADEIEIKVTVEELVSKEVAPELVVNGRVDVTSVVIEVMSPVLVTSVDEVTTEASEEVTVVAAEVAGALALVDVNSLEVAWTLALVNVVSSVEVTRELEVVCMAGVETVVKLVDDKRALLVGTSEERTLVLAISLVNAEMEVVEELGTDVNSEIDVVEVSEVRIFVVKAEESVTDVVKEVSEVTILVTSVLKAVFVETIVLVVSVEDKALDGWIELNAEVC